MRLTLVAKLFVTLVILGVIGYAVWHYKGAEFRTRMDRGAGTAEGPNDSPGAAAPPVPSASGQSSTAVVPAGTSSASTPQTAVLARIRETKVLRVGMEPDAPPLHFVNENSQEDGFDFMLAAKIARRLGAEKVQVVEADYEDLPGRLRNGEVDVIMAGYVPDPSVEGVDWSQAYLEFGLCLIVREDMVSKIKSPQDLAGRSVAIYDDPAAEKWVVANIPGAKISKFSGDSGWFEAVERGLADALIYDYPFASVEIRKHPRTSIVRYNLNSSKYAIGVPEKNYDLVFEINKAIDEIRSSTAYADLMRKYLASTSETFTAPVAGRKTYTVREGDTLSLIARNQLKERERWREIWTLNSDRVANPDLIYPRLVLVMP